MNEEILQGTIAFAATCAIGILFILIASRKSKKKHFGMKNMPVPSKRNDDPLKLLREDTYSNEELDEMTGRMHREQYRKENN